MLWLLLLQKIICNFALNRSPVFFTSLLLIFVLVSFEMLQIWHKLQHKEQTNQVDWPRCGSPGLSLDGFWLGRASPVFDTLVIYPSHGYKHHCKPKGINMKTYVLLSFLSMLWDSKNLPPYTNNNINNRITRLLRSNFGT